jgi:hypothetical protein
VGVCGRCIPPDASVCMSGCAPHPLVHCHTPAQELMSTFDPAAVTVLEHPGVCLARVLRHAWEHTRDLEARCDCHMSPCHPLTAPPPLAAACRSNTQARTLCRHARALSSSSLWRFWTASAQRPRSSHSSSQQLLPRLRKPAMWLPAVGRGQQLGATVRRPRLVLQHGKSSDAVTRAVPDRHAGWAT